MFTQRTFMILRVEYIHLKRLFIVIRRSKEFVQIRGIEEHLRIPLRLFTIFLWTFLLVSKMRLKFNLFAGSLSAHSVGLMVQEDWIKTLKLNPFTKNKSVLFLILLPFYADFSL